MPLPDWSLEDARVRILKEQEVSELQEYAKGRPQSFQEEGSFECLVVARSTRNHLGERLFKDAEFEILKKKSPELIKKIAAVALKDYKKPVAKAEAKPAADKPKPQGGSSGKPKKVPVKAGNTKQKRPKK